MSNTDWANGEGVAHLTRRFDAHDVTARYEPLGLTSNPFLGFGGMESSAAGREVTSESNRLLRAIVSAVDEDAPRPIWVAKSDDIPDAYHTGAEGRLEAIFAQDEALSVVHAYVPLFAMKSGAVRSTLGLLGERLLVRRFDLTLAAYVEKILAEPDESLASFQVLGPERYREFAAEFAADPLAAVHDVLGTPERERQPLLAELADMRQVQFQGDVVEDDATPEIDETVGDAPGTAVLMSERAQAEESRRTEVADYIIEYTREHLSPVIGRTIRVYQNRGISAAVDEIKITKAPRKTLAALARLARVRFKKLVIMYDGFDNWSSIDPELRVKIVGLLSELRWSLANDAVFVFLVRAGRAPELEESFGSGTRIAWDFPGLPEMEQQRDAILPQVVDRWLENAARPGCEPLSSTTGPIAAAIDAADGSLSRLLLVGAAAFEIASEEQRGELGAQHVAAALSELEESAGGETSGSVD